MSSFSPGSIALLPGYIGSSVFLIGNSGIDQSLESERAGFTSGPTTSLALGKMLNVPEPPASPSVGWQQYCPQEGHEG